MIKSKVDKSKMDKNVYWWRCNKTNNDIKKIIVLEETVDCLKSRTIDIDGVKHSNIVQKESDTYMYFKTKNEAVNFKRDHLTNSLDECVTMVEMWETDYDDFIDIYGGVIRASRSISSEPGKINII